MTNINLINLRHSKVDLSSVYDADGKMIILQPKGNVGDRRECRDDILDHPHIQTALQAKWVRYESVSLVPVDTALAAPPAEPVAEPVAPPPALEEPPTPAPEPATTSDTPTPMPIDDPFENSETTSRRKRRDR